MFKDIDVWWFLIILSLLVILAMVIVAARQEADIKNHCQENNGIAITGRDGKIICIKQDMIIK